MGKAQSVGTRASAVFKAMADVASDDVTRYNLQRVRVERTSEGCTLTATNGHILAHVEIQDAGIVAELTAGMPQPVAYLMPDDASKRASVQAPFAWEVEGDDTFYWPDYKQVIPERCDDPREVTCVAAQYMVTLGRFIERMAKATCGYKTPGVRFQSGGPLNPVRLDTHWYGVTIVCAWMPMRM